MRRILFGFALLVTAVAPTTAVASGYYVGTKGARAAGRGGAFTARADDLSAVVANPAGLTHIGTTLIQLGNRFSHNAYSFQRAPTLDWGDLSNGVPPYVEFDVVDNQTPWQLLDPLVGVASNFGLKDWAFAIAAYAPAGIGRMKFPVDGGQRYMMVSRDAMILNYTASAAWKWKEVFGVGASATWVHVPKLEYQIVIDANVFPGRVNPVSSELDMHATVSGADLFTFNAVVGAWYRPVPFLEIGISGQIIPSQIETKSTLEIDPLSDEIEGNVDLRRDGESANDVSLSLALPLTARAGVRYRHLRGDDEIFDIELDVGYESWSRVKRFTVDGDGLIGYLEGQRLDVGTIEVEKQWRDTVSVQLGGDYSIVPKWFTMRGGFFFDSAVAPPSHANVDFIGGHLLGGVLGASILIKGLEIALAYEYRHQLPVQVNEGAARVFQETPGSQCQPPYTDESLCHPEFVGRPGPSVNAGTYRARSHVASLDLLYRF